MSIPVSPGSLLGLPAFIGNQPYSLTAKAPKGAEFGFVSREQILRFDAQRPRLSLRILSVLAAEVRTARNAISEVLRRPVPHRSTP